VTRHHDGRSFSTLTITAAQQKGPIGVASVSMHAAEGGRECQSVAAVGELPGPELDVDIGLIPWETRTADDLDATTIGPPEFELWMRTPSVDPALAAALAAYATDLTLIGTALRPLDGFGQRGNGTQFTSAVTGHTIWFHRPFTTDQWLLLRQHSPLLAHGRSFGRGDVLTSDGELVASYAQESLLRIPN
jgi:acyl-CoA thioesterase-2